MTSRGGEAPAAPPVTAAPAPAAAVSPAPAAAPSPSPAPATPGTLVLAIDPSDAQVELDGRTVDGTKPIVVEPPGTHSIKVSAPNRRPFEKEVDVALGATVELHVQLAPVAPSGKPGKRPGTRPKPPKSETYTLDPFGGQP